MHSTDSTPSQGQDLESLIRNINKQEADIKKGGGAERKRKRQAKGSLTARGRIQPLTDDGSRFNEGGLWAGYDMYEEEGGCPAGGVVTGVGSVSGRECVIVANDATVKAGAWFPITAKKNLRAQ